MTMLIKERIILTNDTTNIDYYFDMCCPWFDVNYFSLDVLQKTVLANEVIKGSLKLYTILVRF